MENLILPIILTPLCSTTCVTRLQHRGLQVLSGCFAPVVRGCPLLRLVLVQLGKALHLPASASPVLGPHENLHVEASVGGAIPTDIEEVTSNTPGLRWRRVPLLWGSGWGVGLASSIKPPSPSPRMIKEDVSITVAMGSLSIGDQVSIISFFHHQEGAGKKRTSYTKAKSQTESSKPCCQTHRPMLETR